jgi:hypothetical protein
MWGDAWKRLREECEVANNAARADARAGVSDRIDYSKSAAEAKAAAEAAAEAKAAAEALAKKKARRAEIGAVEIEITRGDKDWGTPWGAIVTSAKGRDNYDFSVADYDIATEILTIKCVPGSVIAWGQKNFRKPKHTIHQRRRVTDDWRIVRI